MVLAPCESTTRGRNSLEGKGARAGDVCVVGWRRPKGPVAPIAMVVPRPAALAALAALAAVTHVPAVTALHHWRPSTGITAHLRSPSSGSRGSATQATAACAAVATAWLHKGRGPRDPVQQGGGHDDSCDDLPKCLLASHKRKGLSLRKGGSSRGT